MGSTISAIRVTYTCRDCSEDWDEEYPTASEITGDLEHPDCTYEECDACGCTCEGCPCDAGEECDQCGCGEGEEDA